LTDQKGNMEISRSNEDEALLASAIGAFLLLTASESPSGAGKILYLPTQETADTIEETEI
jgi:hypothetical protein